MGQGWLLAGAAPAIYTAGVVHVQAAIQSISNGGLGRGFSSLTLLLPAIRFSGRKGGAEGNQLQCRETLLPVELVNPCMHARIV
jgi:hypothetical protein